MASPRRAWREKNILGLGGAALMTSTAAKRIVCVVPGMYAKRAGRAGVFVASLVLGFLLGNVSPLAASNVGEISEKEGAAKTAYLFHASLNETTLEEKVEEFQPI